mgnify:CR=1 FL=1
MTESEAKQIYAQAYSSYREVFQSMDRSARAIWFFTMDEAEILSFLVGPGESVDGAKGRHGVKLGAMADALAHLLKPGEPADEVENLRLLAKQHGYGEPTPSKHPTLPRE